MDPIYFYIEYRNTYKVMLPVNPEKLSIKLPGDNETERVIGLGEISLLQTPGLQTLTLESFIPTNVPISKRGTYVNQNSNLQSPKFYRDLFTALMQQKEAINLVISGLNISLKMSIEDFEYSWKGSDEDMYYELSLKEYRTHTVKTVELKQQSSGTSQTSTTAKTTTTNRANTPKQVTPNTKVKVNGRLHRDSYGTGPGATEKDAIRIVNFVKKGRKCPYHVTTLSGGWRGWVAESSVEVI